MNTAATQTVEKEVPKAPVKKTAAKKSEPKKLSAKDARKITLLVAKNPHRKGSVDFKKYTKLAELRAETRTVAKAREAGVDSGYLNYMVTRKVVKFG